MILATERLENIQASLFKYVEANYTETAIDYAGVGIKEEDLDEWIRLDVMNPMPRYARQVNLSGHMGAESLVMLSANIFTKQSYHEGNPYRILRIKDILANLFRVPLGIPVKDWVENSGANQIGVLQTSELEAENSGLDDTNGVYQYNLTSTMRYVMAWEAP